MKTVKSKIYDVEMWELMRDWLHSKGFDYTLEAVFPANQVFTLYRKQKLVEVYRCFPDIRVYAATGDPSSPYTQTHILDNRDPECFNKLEKLLHA